MTNKEELIRKLAQIIGTETVAETSESRFEADSNTLYTDAKQKSQRFSKQKQTSKNERFEISIDTKEFTEIVTGIRRFCVLKEKNIRVNDTIVFHETENLKQTGRMNIKIVDYVTNNEIGLKDEYSIISFN